MFPIALDLTRIPVLLAGHGELIERRLVYLDEAKASRVTVYSPDASEKLKQLADGRLIERLPEPGDITQNTVILLGGLPRETAEKIVSWARTMGKLVNVEDVNDLCDFYFTANVRRGDLIIAVSTSGASPTLARKLRDFIADRFGAEWAERTQEMSALRKSLKAKGASMREVLEASERYLKDKGWLKEREDA